MVFIISYLVSSIIVIMLLSIFKVGYKKFPKLKIKKRGIVLYSNKKHRINIFSASFVAIGGNVYIKENKKTVIIKNVINAFKRKNFLYFTANGKVEIIVDCSRFYKYFNIVITSKELNFNKFKSKTETDILDNLTNLDKCENLNKYLTFIRKILRIDINNKRIIIKPNSFKFSYTILYKLNNKLKRVNINQTLWKF